VGRSVRENRRISPALVPPARTALPRAGLGARAMGDELLGALDDGATGSLSLNRPCAVARIEEQRLRLPSVHAGEPRLHEAGAPGSGILLAGAPFFRPGVLGCART